MFGLEQRDIDFLFNGAAFDDDFFGDMYFGNPEPAHVPPPAPRLPRRYRPPLPVNAQDGFDLEGIDAGLRPVGERLRDEVLGEAARQRYAGQNLHHASRQNRAPQPIQVRRPNENAIARELVLAHERLGRLAAHAEGNDIQNLYQQPAVGADGGQGFLGRGYVPPWIHGDEISQQLRPPLNFADAAAKHNNQAPAFPLRHERPSGKDEMSQGNVQRQNGFHDYGRSGVGIPLVDPARNPDQDNEQPLNQPAEPLEAEDALLANAFALPNLLPPR
jgi:hypothetical protein